MTSACKRCGAAVERSKGRGRPRVYCLACNPSRAEYMLARYRRSAERRERRRRGDGS